MFAVTKKAFPSGEGGPRQWWMRRSESVPQKGQTYMFFNKILHFRPGENFPYFTKLRLSALKGLSLKSDYSVIPNSLAALL